MAQQWICNCGVAIDPSDRFCPHCGQSLTQSSAGIPTQVLPPAPPPTDEKAIVSIPVYPDERAAQVRSTILIWSGLILGGILGIVLAVFLGLVSTRSIAVDRPTIDGILSRGEWDNAETIDFEVLLPAGEGGGTTPGTLYIMNDATNLYLAVKVVRKTRGSSSASFQFDNDNDGTVSENGEDVLLINPESVEYGFYDGVRTNAPPCPEGHAAGYCGFEDVTAGGTNDGAGAATNNGLFTFYEYAHVLNSADDLHDFSLARGDTVGYQLSIRFCNTRCVDTYVPIAHASVFGKIVIK